MRAKRKPSEKNANGNLKDFIHCPDCGKRRYIKRAGAKAVIKSLPDNRAMREYRCPVGEGWHIGHLPSAVRRGLRSDVEEYNRRAARDERRPA